MTHVRTAIALLLAAVPFVAMLIACERPGRSVPTASHVATQPSATSLVSSFAECQRIDVRATTEFEDYIENHKRCTTSRECGSTNTRVCDWATGYQEIAASAIAGYQQLAETSPNCRAYRKAGCEKLIVKPQASAAYPGPPICRNGKCTFDASRKDTPPR
jgi:hypothetical protein